MGIEPPYIGSIWYRGMVGVGGEGYGVVWVEVGLVSGGSGYFESGLQHSPAPESCATPPEEPCSMTVPTTYPGLRGLSFGTISYASLSVITRMTRWRLKQPVNHPKNLSTKTRIIGCIYSGKFGTEVAASVMGELSSP